MEIAVLRHQPSALRNMWEEDLDRVVQALTTQDADGS
jgi:hypothetical protein